MNNLTAFSIILLNIALILGTCSLSETKQRVTNLENQIGKNLLKN